VREILGSVRRPRPRIHETAVLQFVGKGSRLTLFGAQYSVVNRASSSVAVTVKPGVQARRPSSIFRQPSAAVLSNGEGWFAVHPLVRDHVRRRAAEMAEAKPSP
jgi:hypothetical protein